MALMELIASDERKRAAREMQRAAQLARGYYDQIANDEGLSGLQAGESTIKDIEADPMAVAAMRSALEKMMARADGGLTIQDQAALQQIQDQQAMQEQGARGAIMQNMRARGMGSSGMNYAAQLSNAQNAANQARAQGLGVGAQAQERALQALMQGGQMASNLRSQSFGEKADKARQRDAINMFNAQMRNAMFANKMGLAGQRSGLDMQGAGAVNQAAQQAAQTYENIGQQAAQLATGIATMGAKPAADAAAQKR